LADLFARLTSAQIKADVIATAPLQEATDVHRALEARQTTGPTVLMP